MIENLFDLDFSRWNDFILSILPASINIGIFLYVSLFLPQKRTNNSFSVFVLLLGVWQVVEGFIRMSITAETAFEWARLSEVLLLLLIPSGIIFMLHFSGWYKKIPNNLAFPMLFLPTIVLLFFVIVRLDKFTIVKSAYWHWVATPQPTFITILLYLGITIGSLLMLALPWLFYTKTKKNDPKQKQALLLAMGFTVPVVGGIALEIIFPLVFNMNSIPVTSSLVTFFSVSAMWALTKYKFLDFSPKHQWDQIVESMNEGIMIVNTEGKIMYANKAFCNLTGYAVEELLGRVAGNLFFEDGPEQLKQLEQVRKARMYKQTNQNEIQIKTKSGERIWLIANISPYLDSTGKKIGSIGIHTDITQRKKAEEKLIENEFFLRESQKSANIGSYSANFVTGYWQSSETLDKIFGIDKNYDRNNAGWLAIVHPEDKQEMGSFLLSEVMGKQKSFSKEYRIVRVNDKQTKWVQELGEVKMDASGNLIEMMGTIQDITERKKSEEIIRQLSQAVEQSPVSIIITDIKGMVQYVNPKFVEVSGYSLNEIIGKNPRILKSGHTNPDQYKQLWGMLARGVEWHGELHNKKKNGELYWESATISAIKNAQGEITNFLAIKEDITERKKTEEALLQSETNFRAIFENTNIGFLLLNADFTMIAFNTQCNELAKLAFGKELQNNANLLKYLSHKRSKIFTTIINKVLSGVAMHYETDYSANNKNAIWLHVSCKPVFNKDGKVVEISLALRDITERKLSELLFKEFTHDLLEAKNKLEYSELRLKQAQAIAHVGSWELDFAKEISIWSEETCMIFGVPVEENKQSYQSWLSFIHPEDLKFVLKKIKDADAPKEGSSFHHRILRKDKTIRYLYSQSQFEFNKEGQAIGIYGVVQDVTEQKIIEQEILLKSEQLLNLTSHLQHIREEERTTISREIHDELGQQLTALKMDIDWILHKQNNKEEVVIAKLNEMLNMSDGVINTVRRISSDLRPAIIDDMGLIAALEWKCNDFWEKTGVDCHFISTVKERKFEDNFSINAFRILQETLTNVSRHSGAKSVNVSVSENETELFLEITDNGKGISENAQNGKTLGIIGMKERAALLGGKLLIEGTGNKGTHTKLILPMKNENAIS